MKLLNRSIIIKCRLKKTPNLSLVYIIIIQKPVKCVASIGFELYTLHWIKSKDVDGLIV